MKCLTGLIVCIFLFVGCATSNYSQHSYRNNVRTAKQHSSLKGKALARKYHTVLLEIADDIQSKYHQTEFQFMPVIRTEDDKGGVGFHAASQSSDLYITVHIELPNTYDAMPVDIIYIKYIYDIIGDIVSKDMIDDKEINGITINMYWNFNGLTKQLKYRDSIAMQISATKDVAIKYYSKIITAQEFVSSAGILLSQEEEHSRPNIFVASLEAGVTIMEEPSPFATSLSQLPEWEEVKVISAEKDYFKVQHNDIIGYVHYDNFVLTDPINDMYEKKQKQIRIADDLRKQTEISEAKQMYEKTPKKVTVRRANVRENKSTSSKIIDTLVTNKEVFIQEKIGDWYRVYYYPEEQSEELGDITLDYKRGWMHQVVFAIVKAPKVPQPRKFGNAALDRDLQGNLGGSRCISSWKYDRFAFKLYFNEYNCKKGETTAALLAVRYIFDSNNQALPDRIEVYNLSGDNLGRYPFRDIPSLPQ